MLSLLNVWYDMTSYFFTFKVIAFSMCNRCEPHEIIELQRYVLFPTTFEVISRRKKKQVMVWNKIYVNQCPEYMMKQYCET